MNSLYYNFKQANKMLGEICLLVEHNLDGEIISGFANYSEFQNKGLMTKGVSGMIFW